MKELTKLLLETGIVERSTARLLQRWGALTPEEYAKISQKEVITETLETFVEELELLNQPEAIEKRETRVMIPYNLIPGLTIPKE